jgi:two-component system sensor histidine kinase UhpB
LTNIARHSDATKAKVELTVSRGGASLTIRDNGRGISDEEIKAPFSLGLLGMRERADSFGGELIIEGKAGKGTVLRVTTVPSAPDRKRKRE